MVRLMNYLGPVIKFQEGSQTPHDGEDVQTLVVVTWQLRGVFLILQGDQTREQLGGLKDNNSMNISFFFFFFSNQQQFELSLFC